MGLPRIVEIPRVSVIIVNWNGAGILPQCLASLARQTYTDFEIIVVDNGSIDGSVDQLEKRWPEIRVKRLKENLGFAKANNLGGHLARGLWLALLNSDAFPEPGWLKELVQASEKYPDFSFFASHLIKADQPELYRRPGRHLSYQRDGLAAGARKTSPKLLFRGVRGLRSLCRRCPLSSRSFSKLGRV